MARKIKTGDTVVVTAGRDKGKTGRVLKINGKSNRILVEGVNKVWKHVRPNRQNPQGGRIQKDAPVHISNVMPLAPGGARGSRVRFEVRDGQKRRIAVRGGTDLGQVGKR